MRRRQKTLAPWLLGLGLALACGAAAAQSAGPPLTIIVPYPAGSPSHRVAQQLAAAVGVVRGAKATLEVESGNGGRAAIERLMKSDPAGGVVLFSDMRRVGSASLVDRGFAFDATADIAPVGALARAPLDVAVGREVAAAQAALDPQSGDAASRPWRIVAGPPASDSYACALTLKGRLFPSATVRSLRGAGPALEEVLAGRADLLCDTRAVLSPYVANRMLVSKPVEALLPGVALVESVWYGVYAPRGIAAPALAALVETLKEVRADIGFRESLKVLAADVAPAAELDPEALRARMKADRAALAPLVEAAGAVVK